MVRLREIPRTAAFAWSSGTSKPLLVTGTRAGAVDVDFSDETKLELWDLDLDNQEQGLELQPIASLSTESRYGQLLTIRDIVIYTDFAILDSTTLPGALPMLTTLEELLRALLRMVL